MRSRQIESGMASYEPNPVLAWIYHRFFEHIGVDKAWADRVRQAEARGTAVYILRNLSFVDFLALDYLTKRLGLPQVRFANDLGLWVFEPMGRGWLSALEPRSEAREIERLRRVLDDGFSAALFLKRPPSLLEPSAVSRQRGGTVTPLPTRGKTEGDAYLRGILEAQRAQSTPILLVPQVFVWTRNPDARKQNAVDALFGPREWPGKIRTVMQFLANRRYVTLRAGEPVDVRAFLEQEMHGHDGEAPTDEVLVRRLTYTLLRRLERERRSVIGPAKKSADRLHDQVVRSPRLQKFIRNMAGEGATERRVLGFRALSMLRDMEAEVDQNAVRALNAACDHTIKRMYAGIEIDEAGLARLREAAKDGTLILLPSHKSHVDYIILTRLFFRSNMPVPIVAAGDNLAFFPLGPILRRAGAFFIRRSFKGDRLYGAVVDAYMRRLLMDGWSLEFFLEGGRSRTGKLLPPKLGLLSIVVDAVLGAEKGYSARRVFFCPISIGYERVVEERSYVRELTGGDKQKEDVGGLLRAAETALGRYGRLNVQFGELLNLQQILGEIERERPSDGATSDLAKLTPPKRRALVTRLAYRVMNEINRVTAVTPGALVATALLTHKKKGISHPDLVAACDRIARILVGSKARFTPSLVRARTVRGALPVLRHEAICEACELFLRAGHVEVHRPGDPIGDKRSVRPGPEAFYVVPDVARLSLDIAKNLLVHFFVSRAMIAIPLTARDGARAHDAAGAFDHALLAERTQALSRLFKYEFQFRADASFETIFAETLSAMESDGEITRDASGNVRLASEGEGHERMVLYARMVRHFVEGYAAAARSLAALLKGALSHKDLVKRAMAIGERMFLAGEIESREAVSRPIVENALLAFVDLGYLARTEGKLALPESCATSEAVRTVEGRVASYL
ncbi:MAG: 1-acyl-sn-glycerol-3-phosphate acyltransferase [Polyangiaceae bacterium]|nr:1-acyl-sn-glycerol-3-phosphate acyltransferase [Polyangiaceae bacterium]